MVQFLSYCRGERERDNWKPQSCRRSEIFALNVEDIAISEVGMRITVWRSKGNQEGEVVVVMRTNSGSKKDGLNRILELVDTLSTE